MTCNAFFHFYFGTSIARYTIQQLCLQLYICLKNISYTFMEITLYSVGAYTCIYSVWLLFIPTTRFAPVNINVFV